MTNKILEAVRAYRQEHNKSAGVVLVYGNEVYGWKNALRDPQHERPGALAVDVDEKVYTAVGGNDQDGAERWEITLLRKENQYEF